MGDFQEQCVTLYDRYNSGYDGWASGRASRCGATLAGFGMEAKPPSKPGLILDSPQVPLQPHS